MKPLLRTLVILMGLIGLAGAVWAKAEDDFDAGLVAYKACCFALPMSWYRKAAEWG